MSKTLVSRPVYAEAYKNASKACLTHAVEVASDGREIRVMCNTVKFENVCEGAPENRGEPPTCKVCLRAWEKWQKSGGSVTLAARRGKP